MGDKEMTKEVAAVRDILGKAEERLEFKTELEDSMFQTEDVKELGDVKGSTRETLQNVFRKHIISFSCKQWLLNTFTGMDTQVLEGNAALSNESEEGALQASTQGVLEWS